MSRQELIIGQIGGAGYTQAGGGFNTAQQLNRPPPFGCWLAQASFYVAPTTYAPLAVKNLSPKRGLTGGFVSDFDYLGATWFYRSCLSMPADWLSV